MGTCLRLDAGARLYRDVMIGAYSNIFSGTTWARISPAAAGATCVIADFIQGANSIVGRHGAAPGAVTYGTWDHGYDTSTSSATADYMEPYHSFFWFGLVGGYLQIEVFDGRPVTGSVSVGTGSHLTITSSTPVPTGTCSHVACVADWTNVVGSVGTYTIYLNGVAVGSGATNPSPNGVGDFFYDFPSLTIGTSKDGYRPQVGTMRLMNLRGATTKYTAAELLSEANSPCALVLGYDKFHYPFDASSGLNHAPPTATGLALILETGTINLAVADCCDAPTEPPDPPDPPIEPPEPPPPQPPEVAPSYNLDVRYIRRLRRAPHVANENTRMVYRKFELDLERGVGLATGQGEDPLVMLRLSRDGGHTWGEPQLMSAGRLGAYSQRVMARRLGQARDTVFEVTVSDPVAWSLVQAWLDLEPGTN